MSWQECREPQSPGAPPAPEQGPSGRDSGMGLLRQGCPPPPASQAGRSLALLLPLAGSCVRLAEAHKFFQFSRVPSAPQRVGRGRRPGLLPRAPPPQTWEAGRGPGGSWLDWMEPRWRGQDEFLTEIMTSENWGCGEEVRACAGVGAGRTCQSCREFGRPDPLLVPSRPFPRSNRNI